jgi:transcriptional regulator with XRE-family HTH domain
MDFAEKLGSRIREVRRSKGMTQGTLASRSKLTRPYISQIEAGKSWIRIDTLEQICKGLNVQPSELLSGIEILN